MNTGEQDPGAARQVLAMVPDEVPDATLDVDQLGSRIVGLAGRLAAATCRWLLLVAAFDARDGCARYGVGTTARWLGHYCGLSRRTAVEHVRVARALAAHPRLREEMSAGRLSYSQVRAISRLCDRGDPLLIDELIVVAQNGTVRQLEDVVRGLRSVDDAERALPPSERERVTHRWRSDSSWGLSARLDPENGAVVEAALAAVAKAEGIPRAQALTRMAEIALAARAEDGAAPSLRGDRLAAIQVHVEEVRLGALDAEPADSEKGGTPRQRRSREREHRRYRRPAGRIVGGPGLPPRVLERLLCSGRIRTVLVDHDHHPLDVGRNNRVVSKRMFTALLLRDGGCAFPGCASHVGLEAHHVRHWIRGGRTVMANLLLLCRRHHHAHHDGEFAVEPASKGRFRFLRPDGRELPSHVQPGHYAGDGPPIEDEHHAVAATAATTRWSGSRLDLDYAVSVLTPGLRGVGRRGYGPWAA